MFTRYLSCPLLLSEASLINDPHISNFLTFLEDRGYAHRTIRLYLGAVVHFECKRSFHTVIDSPI